MLPYVTLLSFCFIESIEPSMLCHSPTHCSEVSTTKLIWASPWILGMTSSVGCQSQNALRGPVTFSIPEGCLHFGLSKASKRLLVPTCPVTSVMSCFAFVHLYCHLYCFDFIAIWKLEAWVTCPWLTFFYQLRLCPSQRSWMASRAQSRGALWSCTPCGPFEKNSNSPRRKT